MILYPPRFVTLHRMIRLLLAATLFLTMSAWSGTLPDAELFFKNANFSGAKLSPNAKFVAVRIPNKEHRASLVVLDLATMTPQPVASFEVADVVMFQWINDERLILNVGDLQAAQADIHDAPGLYAVNRDGTEFRQLVERNIEYLKSGLEANILPWNNFFIAAKQNQTGNDVFIGQIEGYGKNVDQFWQVKTLNTRNGRTVTLDAPAYANEWFFDKDGTLRVVVIRKGHMRTVQYNDPSTGQWRKLAEFDFLSNDAFEPITIGPDNVLYVASNNGKDKTAIYRFDLEHNRLLPDAVVSSAKYDIDGGLLFNQDRLVGVRYDVDGEVTQWFDPEMAALQKTIDRLLPTTTNRIDFGTRAETPYVVIDAFSDVLPHTFLLFNKETKKMSRLGASHPDIESKKMSKMDLVHVTARDGMDIPTYVTIPNGSSGKNLPMVVLVHGGPWVRGGFWQWEPEVQFLASRGYVVLQPEFRGSVGYGYQHFHAGWKQWGRAMQDDVADAAKWAISSGIADPQRICIAGASYGGYATLMGLVNNPDIFRCGIDWVGVTDIDLLYSVKWSDTNDVQKKYGMPVMIGDPVKEAEQLKAVSPLVQAARIKQPLLLAYGGVDERVPEIHGEKFYKAVKVGNQDVEWVSYPDEGHGWRLLKNKVDFWTRVEKFLDKNIGQHIGQHIGQ